ELEENGYNDEIIATCTTTPEILQQLVQYETLADASRAMDRVASAFVRNTTEEQQSAIKQYAGEWNIRVFGKPNHLQLIGKDADKGMAIRFIHDNIRLFLPDVND